MTAEKMFIQGSRLTYLRILFVLGLCYGSFSSSEARVGGWGALDIIFKTKGTLKGNVYDIVLPRTDLQVKDGNALLNPNFALTTRLAFQPAGKEIRVLGDLVLLQTEVSTVMKRLLGSGFIVSALHDELSGEEPEIDHLYFQGHGKAEELADSIKSVLVSTGTPFVEPKLLLNQPPWKGLDYSMNAKGERTGMVIEYNFARADKVMLNGVELPAENGSGTHISYQDFNGDVAAAGTFALVATEVGPVTKLLLDNGITITSIHDDLSGETPKLTFISFWAEDDPIIIAKTIRSALDTIQLKKN